MSVANHDGRGAALANAAGEVLLVSEALGPVTLTSRNEGVSPIVISVEDKATGKLIATDDETAVAAEDTVYDGNNSTLAFSGEALDNVPIIPKSVVIKPTSGNETVNLFDRDGDGKLYTADVDEDLAGTIDYATGDLVLNFPSGKSPNTTNILADYSHASAETVVGGITTTRVSNNPPLKDLSVKATGLGGNSVAQVTATVPF